MMKLGKSLGTYTARGIITEEFTRVDKPKRIRLFDGSFTTVFVVKEFYAIPCDFSDSSAPDFVLKLATSPNLGFNNAFFCDPSDSREIAWAGCAGAGFAAWNQQAHAIDPDNVVVEDLWIYGNTIGSTDTPLGYMIVMEKFEVSKEIGAISMSRDRANEPEAEWTFR
jgi:hypothetical protein